ncbi:uncharacterized protein LOC128186887 [Crassostrea angulata]|uniref:uncharacterized protein LOC128186887 n=1 Tax=Magallana angulata TaxID=2784310 RepID=UPI0022B15D6A|nr:uncharacterized protein LOC128186887 [Crassostrea angulata]
MKLSILYEMDVCYFWFISVLTGFSILLNLHDIQSLKTSGVCKQYDGSHRCCSNYRQEGQHCIPCVGSFGINCSGRCVDGFYGFGCLNRCNCSDDQICDHVVGCKRVKTKHDTESTRIYILSLSSGFIICLLVLLVIVAMKRKMTPSRNYQQELVNTESTLVEYSFPEHQGYLEYDPRQMLEIVNPEHRFKDSQSRKSRFEHYESINSKHISTKVKTISS